jgi:hypothetical protein
MPAREACRRDMGTPMGLKFRRQCLEAPPIKKPDIVKEIEYGKAA